MVSKNNDMVKLLVGVLVLALVLLLLVPCLKDKKNEPVITINDSPEVPHVAELEQELEQELEREWNKLVNENPGIENNISKNEFAELTDQFTPEQIKEHFLNEGFKNPKEVQASEGVENNELSESVQSNQEPLNNLPNECYPKDVLNAGDLLPAETNSQWAQANPAGQGSISDKNFLNAGYHVGVNTVGQSLRNANRQLRSDPPNPQVKVSPWMQTTIEPDINRKPFEVGA
jgi:hypothetical protein